MYACFLIGNLSLSHSILFAVCLSFVIFLVILQLLCVITKSASGFVLLYLGRA